MRLTLTRASLRRASLISCVLAAACGGFWWGAEQKYPFRQYKKWTAQAPVVPMRAQLHGAFAVPVDTVMIGDSLTAGLEWHEVFPGRAIANRGIGGDTTADILRRMDTILAAHPRRAFVMAGINDVSQEIEADVVIANYRQILDRLSGERVEVVVQSTIECSESRCGPRALAGVRRINTALRAIAAERGHRFLELNEGIVDSAHGLLPDYTHDGVHLNAQGYQHWLKRLQTVI